MISVFRYVIMSFISQFSFVLSVRPFVCVCVWLFFCLFFQWNCLSSLYFINWKWSRKNEIYTKNTERCNCLHKTHFSARCEFEYLLAPQAIHLITIILNFLATLLPFDHSKSTSMPIRHKYLSNSVEKKPILKCITFCIGIIIKFTKFSVG